MKRLISESSNGHPRKWSNLTNKEFLEIYSLVLENAERHFRCSNALHNVGEHQNAIAHLILCTEELIKSLACLLVGKDFNLRSQDWFNKVFSNHATRHDLVKDFFSFYKLMRIFFGRSDEKKSFTNKLLVLFNDAFFIYQNYLWWENAEQLKKRSFYVDYFDGVINPESLTIEDYHTAIRMVRVFKNDLKEIITEIERAPLSKIKNWQEEFDLMKLEGMRKDLNKLREMGKK